MKWILLMALVQTTGAFANNCAPDVQKYCPNLSFENGEIKKCLIKAKKKLSPGCAVEMNLVDPAKVKKNPCFLDEAKLCAKESGKKDKVELCLIKNESSLSKECTDIMSAKKKELYLNNACMKDMVEKCYPEMSESKEALSRCLMRKKSSLQAICKSRTEMEIIKRHKVDPCFEDALNLCPKATHPYDIGECLEKEIAKVNPDCRLSVEASIKKAEKYPCRKDAIRFCSLGLPRAKLDECFKKFDRELSSACKHDRIRKAKKKS